MERKDRSSVVIMPIDFRFSKLKIHNFRGIRELELELPEKIPVNLIGGNNAGKSTVLAAIALVLRGGGTHKFVPTDFDFFCDSTGRFVEQFSITLSLEAVDEKFLPAVRGGIGNPVPVHGIMVTGSNENGVLRHYHRLIRKDGSPILLNLRVPLKGQTKDDYAGHNVGGGRVYARLDDIRECIPEIWLLQPDNLKSSLYQWKTGPLQRLSQMLAQKFLGSEWVLDFKGQKCPMPEKLQKAHEFFEAAVVSFPFWKDDLAPKLQKTLTEYVGRDTKMDIRPDIQTIETWLAQQLAVSFAADEGGTITPLERMGDGWQSLIRLACLDVLTQYPDQVKDRLFLLFEEPETYLHPHLARKLCSVLARLANNGWTVITTTHAPELISFILPQQVIKLRRNINEVSKGVFITANAENAAKIQEKLDERGGHEMLFAQKAVICEGKNDSFAIRLMLEKFGVDINGKSVSIVRAGDVGALPAYAEIGGKLNVPWCAISDEDILPDGTIKTNTQAARAKLEAIKRENDLLLIWKGDLEACLKKIDGKAAVEWTENLLANKSLMDIEKEFPDFYQVCASLKTWIG